MYVKLGGKDVKVVGAKLKLEMKLRIARSYVKCDYVSDRLLDVKH